VNRDVLFEILRKRCVNERDHHLVSLIEILYKHSVLKIGDHAVKTNKGVPQRGVISPYLFNVYLEEALLKLPTWKKMIELKKVKTYTDDLLVSCNEPSTANTLIKELEEIDSSLGLILNNFKSVILAQPFQQEGKTLTEIRVIPTRHKFTRAEGRNQEADPSLHGLHLQDGPRN